MLAWILGGVYTAVTTLAFFSIPVLHGRFRAQGRRPEWFYALPHRSHNTDNDMTGSGITIGILCWPATVLALGGFVVWDRCGSGLTALGEWTARPKVLPRPKNTPISRELLAKYTSTYRTPPPACSKCGRILEGL